jgi:hypothetical protein
MGTGKGGAGRDGPADRIGDPGWKRAGAPRGGSKPVNVPRKPSSDPLFPGGLRCVVVSVLALVPVGCSNGAELAERVRVSTPDLLPERVVRWDGWRDPLTEVVKSAARREIQAGLEEFRAQRPDLVEGILDVESLSIFHLLQRGRGST